MSSKEYVSRKKRKGSKADYGGAEDKMAFKGMCMKNIYKIPWGTAIRKIGKQTNDVLKNRRVSERDWSMLLNILSQVSNQMRFFFCSMKKIACLKKGRCILKSNTTVTS